MARPTKGPRLYRRADRGMYFIRDGSKFYGTGTRNSVEAEAALARYLAEKGRPAGPSAPHQMTVAAALDIYGTERAPAVKAPERIGYAIAALAPILGSLPITNITSEVCRRYAKERCKARDRWLTRDEAAGTVRKELGVLQAALNYCQAEGYLTSAPKVRLPAKPAPRDRWLTRDSSA